MPFTASNTAACTMAKTRAVAAGAVFAVLMAACVFSFQSVTTSALAALRRSHPLPQTRVARSRPSPSSIPDSSESSPRDAVAALAAGELAGNGLYKEVRRRPDLTRGASEYGAIPLRSGLHDGDLRP